MQGYAWVTGGGIYMVLDDRWCKTTSFHPQSAVAAGWGNWQRLHNVSLANAESPQFRMAHPEDVRPGDLVRLDGPNHWARTTEVNTVLTVETTDDAAAATDSAVLVAGAEAAWICYEQRIEVLAPSAIRYLRDAVEAEKGALTLRIVDEQRANAVQTRTGNAVPSA